MLFVWHGVQILAVQELLVQLQIAAFVLFYTWKVQMVESTTKQGRGSRK